MKLETQDLPPTRIQTQKNLDEYLRELDTNVAGRIEYYSHLIEPCYRAVAVMSYLLDADTDAFFHNMHLAAAIRCRYLSFVQEYKMPHDENYLFATWTPSIYEALASGNQIGAMVSATYRITLKADNRFDTMKGYVESLLLRGAVMSVDFNDPNCITLDELGTYDKKRGTQSQGESDVFWGICERSAKRFERGLRQIIEDRRTYLESEERDVNIEIGERWLFVEGLAYARLGKWLGFNIKIDDPLVPTVLQGEPTQPYPIPKTLWPKRPDKFT